MRFAAATLAVLVLACSPNAYAEVHHSGLHLVRGVKAPNSAAEGTNPVFASVLAPRSEGELGGFNEMLPFAIASPDQDEADSCLYMSLNGIAEWWMAKLHPELSRDPDGPLHFSERYFMNYAAGDESQKGVDDWMTDSVFILNNAGATVSNSDYRFTKGWFRDTDAGYVKSREGIKDAEYGVQYNWVDELKMAAKAPRIPLPKFKRHVIFAGKDASQWETAVMPDNIADRIKAALQKRKAPVQVVYNHQGYWHSTVIVGFNDDLDNQNCSFVQQFFQFETDKAKDLRTQAEKATGAAKEKLLSSAKFADDVREKTETAFEKGGGCHPGVFYVRDSIYGEPTEPNYHYDLNDPKGDAPFSKRIVLLEYDWVRVLANHVTQIWVE